ncbi:hypothetical protein [uncultured Serinicoccus sp.]|uniref:hypothetical protein n=1 Tax=uncultured Serinicoccus sp. TaxID=735514 RepID=UPI002631D50A|nr:hypothetical protein [uncultured Serinicoccus sp.]
MATTEHSDAQADVPRPRRVRVTEDFVPSLDLVHLDREGLSSLTEEDRKRVVEDKIADVTHFYVGLESLGQTLDVARFLAPAVRSLPARVRGQVLQPNDTPVDRLSVEPTLPDGRVLGRGVVTGDEGVFVLPLRDISGDDRSTLLAQGLGLRIRGADGLHHLVLDLPPAGGSALGVIQLRESLAPLPRSVVGALVDLVEGLGPFTDEDPADDPPTPPVRVSLGQDACTMVFEEDTAVRRFPYKVLVRLVEPRTTTVTRVSWPRRDGAGVPLVLWNADWAPAFGFAQTSYVDRVPIDRPIGVDRFRDGIIGLRGDTITAERPVPVAGTLGLGYVLNLAQVWKYKGLTLGNLVYSLPLAPGEQQRIAVSERVSTASVRDSEVLEVVEQQKARLQEDASASAVFTTAFEEHVTASSKYSNEARSSSWGVAGGIGAVLGPVVLGVGAGGGGGKSTNKGSTASALDGVRTSTSTAAEGLHRTVESEASGRRSATRSSIRLARESETQSVTTKVITNHNKAHALTIQYWEVLRKFAASTEVEGTTLVCFVPLDIVRFLPTGQPLEITDTETFNERTELVDRWALLHRHADAIQPWLPGRHREGMRLLEDFFANPRQEVAIDGAASDSLKITVDGSFVPYETIWVTVLLRGGRRLRRVELAHSQTELAPKTLATRAEVVAELQRVRNNVASLTQRTATVPLMEPVDRGDVTGFEVTRSFRTLTYQLDMSDNPYYQALENLEDGSFLNSFFDLDRMTSVALSPSDLEGHLGGPRIKDFTVTLNADPSSIVADPTDTLLELTPAPQLFAAVEQNSPLRFRDLLKVERMLQHVVGSTMTYSKAVWSSLTAEERVVMLEGYTIGLPDTGLDAEGLADASQHVPLLNCVANQVLGYYGNSMIMPFSIPASLAGDLAGAPVDDGDDGVDGDEQEPPPSLTTGAVQDALTAFHRTAFSPPESHFTLPTKGVLGEAVLGNCPSAEKIDLTRFWNWQDSPGDEATAIEGVTLRESSIAQLAAPSTLTQVPSVINITPGQGGTLTPGTLTAALAAEAAKQQSFSTDFLGQDVLKALGEKTIASAESARSDALGKATALASQAMTAAVDVHKTATAAKQAQKAEDEKAAKEAKEKQAAEEKAKNDKIDTAVKNLKDNAKAYLAAANAKADLDAAKELATSVITSLTPEPIPTTKAITLFDAFSQEENGTRTQGSTAWLTTLGLL